MKRNREINESSEKQAGKVSDKKIKTFDDLRTSDGSETIDTFDSVKGKGSSERAIRGFDDLESTSRKGDHAGKIESAEKMAPAMGAKEKPVNLEDQRLDKAADGIKRNDWINPEKWKTLSNNEKIIALEQNGGELERAYRSPDPPIYMEKASSERLGSYGDGYSYDAKADKIVGSDYRVTLNEEGIDERQRKLFGDDPRVALETHAHEFRHSYQREQAHAFEHGLMTDDPVKAKEWSENFKHYKYAPEKELAETDPDRYAREYEAYSGQPDLTPLFYPVPELVLDVLC